MRKHKELSYKDLTYVGEGCYGTYYKVKRKNEGIKVLGHGFSSKTEAIEQCGYEVTEEYKKLVKASKRTRLVPRPRGIAIVKQYNSYNKKYEYHIGYMMTHVKGSTVDDSCLSDRQWDQLERARTSMDKLGIILSDDHEANVMKCGKRFIFIDAARFNIRNKKTK